MKKILFYTNQFFGQIGGEEFAYTEPFVEEGPKGPAVGLKAAIPDVEIATRFGKEIAEELKAAGVQGVILTST